MVNSIKHRPVSKEKGRKWTPTLGSEDQHQKKKQREDDYVQEFSQVDRPILIVKKKHAFAGKPRDDAVKNLNGSQGYVKVTEPSQVINDVSSAVRYNEAFIARNTFVHNNNGDLLKDAADPNIMYKVEGIEFLPEGFIELDPLLYKDEYSFNNNLDEKLFVEHQRRMKAVRRKQYKQRNQTKMREVTIYMKDESKEKVIDFLERWYHKHQRRMNEAELKNVAGLMQTDYNTMSLLQDAYLRKKHATNVRVLKDYLCEKGLLREGMIDVPKSLQKYFVESKSPYANVQSKVLNDKGEYNPQYLYNYKQHFQRAKSNTPAQSMKTLKSNKLDRSQNKLNKNLKNKPASSMFDHLSKSFEKIIYKNDNSVAQDSSVNIDVQQDTSAQQSEHKPSISSNENKKDEGYDNDQTLFFDLEINKILDKIKGYKAAYKDDDQERNDSDFDDDVIVNEEEVHNKQEPISEDNRGSFSESKVAHGPEAIKNSSLYFNKKVSHPKQSLKDKRISVDKNRSSQIDEKQPQSNTRTSAQNERSSKISAQNVNDQRQPSDQQALDTNMASNGSNSHNDQDARYSNSFQTPNEINRQSKQNEQSLFNQNRPSSDNRVVKQLTNEKGNNNRNSEYEKSNKPGGMQLSNLTQPRISDVVDQQVEDSFVDSVNNSEQSGEMYEKIYKDQTSFTRINPKLSAMTQNRDAVSNKSSIKPVERDEMDTDYIFDNTHNNNKVQAFVKSSAKVTPSPKENVRKSFGKTQGVKKTPLISSPSPTPQHKIRRDSDHSEERKPSIQKKQKAMTMNQLIALDHKNLQHRDTKQSIPEKVSITSDLRRYDDNPQYKEWAYTRLDNPEDYEISNEYFRNHRGVTEVVQKNGNEDICIGQFIDVYDIVSPKRAGRLISLNMLRLDNDIASITQNDIDLDNLPKRVTIVARDARGTSQIVQQLKPTFIANEYYNMIVQDTINEHGQRTVTIVTRNGDGKAVSVFCVPEESIGQLYDNQLLARIDDETGERRISIAVFNERGDTLYYQNLRATANTILREELLESQYSGTDNNSESVEICAYNEIIDNRGECISCVSELRSLRNITRHSRLRPFFLDNEFYHQTIEEAVDMQGKRKTTVKTFNSQGKLVSEKVIDNKLIADVYYSRLIDEAVDGHGKKSVLQTINSRNEIILSQSVSKRPTSMILRGHVDEIVREIFKDNDSRKISIVEIGNDDRESVVYEEIKPRESFDLQEIITRALEEQEKKFRNDTVVSRKKKSVSPVNISRSKAQTTPNVESMKVGERNSANNDQSRYKSTVSQYYKGDILEIIKEEEEKNTGSKKSTADFRPTILANTYYNDLIYELARKKYIQKRHVSEPVRQVDQMRTNTNSVPHNIHDLGNSKLQKQNYDVNRSDYNENKRNNNSEFLASKSDNEHHQNQSQQKNKNSDIVFEHSFGPPKNQVEVHSKQNALNNNIINSSIKEGNMQKSEFEQIEENNEDFIDNEYLSKKASQQNKSRGNSVDTRPRASQNEDMRNSRYLANEEDNISHRSASEDRNNSPNSIKRSTLRESSKGKNNISEHINTKSGTNKRSDDVKQLYESSNSLRRFDSVSIKEKMQDVLENEKDKFSADVIRRISQKMEKGAIDDNLMDDFHEYCKNNLPNNYKYKESVLFVTLFYYFLKREKLVK